MTWIEQIRRMDKSLWTSKRNYLCDCWALHSSSGFRLSTRFQNREHFGSRICSISSPRASVRGNTVGVPAHPKVVRLGWNQGPLQTSQVLPNWDKRFFIDLALCKQAVSHWNRRGPSRTDPKHYCLKRHCHSLGFLLLKTAQGQN